MICEALGLRDVCFYPNCIYVKKRTGSLFLFLSGKRMSVNVRFIWCLNIRDLRSRISVKCFSKKGRPKKIQLVFATVNGLM